MKYNFNKSDDKTTFADRFATAILTPLFLNIGLFLFSMKPGRHGLSNSTWNYILAGPSPEKSYFLYLWLVPAIVGFLVGSASVSKFFGHLFYTSDTNKNFLVTVLLWLVIIMTIFSLNKG